VPLTAVTFLGTDRALCQTGGTIEILALSIARQLRYPSLSLHFFPSPHLLQLRFELRRQALESIGIFAGKETEQCHGDNLQIEGQTPIAQIVQIVFDTFCD
jgi:hypothetical protein